MAGPYELQLPWLASFVAVIERGSFTAAARATFRSQPRISAHVAALERELGVELLERTSRGARLTEAGARFLPHARAILAELRTGVDSIGPLAGGLHGHVVVGSYPGASAVLLAPLIKRFREEHPGVSVELHEGTPGWMDEAVVHAEIDFAVRTADVPRRYQDVTSRHLFDEPIVLVAPRGHPLATDRPLDPEVLSDETIVVTGDPTGGWTDYRDRLADVGVASERLLTVGEPTTVIALVRAGLGVGLMGALATEVTIYGDLVALKLPRPAWQRNIRAYLNSRRRLSAAAEAFLDQLIAECDDLPARIGIAARGL